MRFLKCALSGASFESYYAHLSQKELLKKKEMLWLRPLVVLFALSIFWLLIYFVKGLERLDFGLYLGTFSGLIAVLVDEYQRKKRAIDKYLRQ